LKYGLFQALTRILYVSHVTYFLKEIFSTGK